MDLTEAEDIKKRWQEYTELYKSIKDIPAKVNLIPFNSFPNSGFQRSSDNAIEEFRDVLQAAGITTITRRPRGEDIAAACGQLAGDITDMAKRKRHFEKLYERDMLDYKVEVICA